MATRDDVESSRPARRRLPAPALDPCVSFILKGFPIMVTPTLDVPRSRPIPVPPTEEAAPTPLRMIDVILTGGGLRLRSMTAS